MMASTGLSELLLGAARTFAEAHRSDEVLPQFVAALGAGNVGETSPPRPNSDPIGMPIDSASRPGGASGTASDSPASARTPTSPPVAAPARNPRAIPAPSVLCVRPVLTPGGALAHL